MLKMHPIPHGGAADLIVAQVELVALAGDVDELRLLEPAEQLRRRQIDAGLAADRVAAGIQQGSPEHVG